MNIFRARKFKEERFSDIKSVKVPEEFKVISEREYDKDVKVKSNPQNEIMRTLNKRKQYSIAKERPSMLFNELNSGKSYAYNKRTKLQNILNGFDDKRKAF